MDKVYWVFSSSVGAGMVVEAAHVRGDIMLVAWVVIDTRSYFCGLGPSFRSGEDVGASDIEVPLALDRQGFTNSMTQFVMGEWARYNSC